MESLSLIELDDLKEKISFREQVNLPSTTHATFGIYRYPAKFIPQVVYYVLEKYAKPKMKVFDPFGGCGTVGIASRIYGCDYELWDLNPILELLHSVATMNPIQINTDTIIQNIKLTNQKFIPKWSRHEYWFAKEFLPFLYNVWGYYHSLKNSDKKRFLAIPLLKVTRFFSYDDIQRQKLSKSKKSEEKVRKLLNSDWQTKFYFMLSKEIEQIRESINEYRSLNPKKTNYKIRCGVDSLNEELEDKKDIIITSPPYLQSQEYIRQAKLDLFWLGHSEKEIRRLSKLEIPYGNIKPCKINSNTYFELRQKFNEKRIQQAFDKYFWGILGALERLQKDINSYIFLFVGDTSMRGYKIPLDKILIEHLTTFGWKHEKTYVDTIINRRLFSYRKNPASRINDKRTAVENLVILKRIS